jgi:hypothetical protein
VPAGGTAGVAARGATRGTAGVATGVTAVVFAAAAAVAADLLIVAPRGLVARLHSRGLLVAALLVLHEALGRLVHAQGRDGDGRGRERGPGDAEEEGGGENLGGHCGAWGATGARR